MVSFLFSSNHSCDGTEHSYIIAFERSKKYQAILSEFDIILSSA